MGKFIDETGNEYFYWTVISRAQNNGTSAMWNCLCRCGNKGIVSGHALRSGNSKSCGCFSSELAKIRRSSNLIGETYNMLTVLDCDHQDSKHNLVWKCLCECGNITYATSYELKSGHKKSCGCLQKIKAGAVNFTDLTSKIFGDLRVINRIGSDKKGQALWDCVCICGNHCVAKSSVLNRHRTLSCGCRNRKSEGEEIIASFLDNKKIKYEREKRFDDCRNIEPLPFDFYVCEIGCIEFDGEQHYKESRLFSNKVSLEQRKQHDQIKTDYCKNNNIRLLRIPYWEKDNIESILSDWLFLDNKEGGNDEEGILETAG